MTLMLYTPDKRVYYLYYPRNRELFTVLGHPQPPTPMKVDNETAISFLQSTMKQKHSKAIDIHFHWMKDRVKQNQFMIYWCPGVYNKGDYVSKHHSPLHHQLMCPQFFFLPFPENTYYITIFMPTAEV